MHNGSSFNTEIRFFLLLVLNLFFPISTLHCLPSFYQPPTRQILMPLYTEHIFVLFFNLNTYIIPSGYTISKVSVLPQFYHSFKISSMRSMCHPSRFILALIYTVQLVPTCFIFLAGFLGYQEFSLFRRYTILSTELAISLGSKYLL